MAYNNFPVGYQPAQIYYPQQSYAQPQQTQQTSSNLIWVQGEAAAKSYLVAPNSTVQLWDSEEQVIYLKSADASGMPSMKILDYKIRETAQPMQTAVKTMPDYVTKDEFAAFETQIKEQIASLTAKPRAKKEEKPDE